LVGFSVENGVLDENAADQLHRVKFAQYLDRLTRGGFRRRLQVRTLRQRASFELLVFALRPPRGHLHVPARAFEDHRSGLDDLVHLQTFRLSTRPPAISIVLFATRSSHHIARVQERREAFRSPTSNSTSRGVNEVTMEKGLLDRWFGEFEVLPLSA
jgi:hypothetical protein